MSTQFCGVLFTLLKDLNVTLSENYPFSSVFICYGQWFLVNTTKFNISYIANEILNT